MTDPPSSWKPLLEAVLEHALSHLEALPVRPVRAQASLEELCASLSQSGGLAAEGRTPEQVLEELVALATPGITASPGPRFFGWVTGGALAASVAADWMTSIWDQNAGAPAGAPAAHAFELTALAWVIDLLGLPPETRGALVTGASVANFCGLAAARSHVLSSVGWDVERDGLAGAPPVRIFAGRERHDSVDKALRLLGFGKRSLVVLNADSEGRMSPGALERELAHGDGPVIVCAQAGNVNSGSFDPLPELHRATAAYARRAGAGRAWLHVDGAFGLWARASREFAELAAGAELADSWATDAHKFLNVPYDCGITLTRHPQAQRRAFAVHGAYLSSGSASAFAGPAALSPELSRRARGFALWAALRQLGRAGTDALVARCARHARALASELSEAEGLSVLNAVVFNQVVLSLRPPAEHDAKRWTSEIARRLQAEGTCFATPTSWRGVPALRFSFVNAGTRDEDVRMTADAVRRVYRDAFGAP